MSAGIYRIINIITNNVYIGCTTNFSNRFNQYKINDVKNQPLIHSSIKKYGIENHNISILFDFQSIIPSNYQLKELESIFIRYYKYWKGCTMLNSNDGGGGSGVWCEEKRKRKSQEIRKNGLRRIILQYDLEGNFIKEWSSISEASKILNIDYNLLIRCCKEYPKNKTVGNFQWRYKLKDKYLQKIDEHIKYIPNKSVLQYDLEGNFIKEWESASIASIELKIYRSEIARLLSTKFKSTKYNKRNNVIKYQWKYKIDNEIKLKISPLHQMLILQI